MADFVIVTDSSCDLSPEKCEELQVKVLQLDVLVDDEPPKLNSEIDSKEFYDKLRAGSMAKTSAVNIDTFLNTFRAIAEQGLDVLYLGFSSGLSNTYNAGAAALKELSEEFPERKLYAVDTKAASLGQGMLVYLAAMHKRSGEDIDEVRDYVTENVPYQCHWFTVDDLHFLKRGGRVSPTVAVVGSVLGIKPILHVDDEGHLISVSKVRGRKAAILKLAETLSKTAWDPVNTPVFISHGDCLEDAEFLAETLKKNNGVKDVYINPVGPVIGAHAGPGVLALFFLGKQR